MSPPQELPHEHVTAHCTVVEMECRVLETLVPKAPMPALVIGPKRIRLIAGACRNQACSSGLKELALYCTPLHGRHSVT